MSTIRGDHSKQNPYAQIVRKTLQDHRISWESAGMLSYFLSLPTDWNISVGHLVTLRDAKEHKIYRMLKELMKFGYCSREEIRENGRFKQYDYIIHEVPISTETKDPHNDCEPLGDFPDAGIPDAEKPPTTEEISKDIKNKKDIVCSAEAVVPPNAASKAAALSAPIATCTKTQPDGTQFTISLEDVFRHAVMAKTSWSAPEMTEAWQILCDYKGPVRTWVRFMEGTIDNLRNSKKYAPITRKTQDSKCKTQNSTLSNSTLPIENPKSSEPVTLIPALLNLISDIKIRPCLQNF